MKSSSIRAVSACALGFALAGCGGNSGSSTAVMSAARLPPSAALLLRYDADHNGTVTRQELDDGIKKDFAAADTNGDACIDRDETRAENARRLSEFGGQASPLTDWNLDGCVDMTEFGNAARSYFTLADRTKDNAVSQQELRGPAMPIAPRSTEGADEKRAAEPTDPDEINRNVPQF